MVAETSEPAKATPLGSGRLTQLLLPHHGSRFGVLDGYRALAALGVVVYHLSGALGRQRGDWPLIINAILSNLGNFCVAVFFLLSGFLLYRPYARAALVDEPGPDPVRFIRHRVLRIYPAYWVALTAAVVLGVLVGVSNPSAKKYSIMYVLVQNYWPAHAVIGLPVAWTLVVEVSFYIALPFIAWFIRLLGHFSSSPGARVRVQLLGLGLLVAGSLLYRCTVAVRNGPFAPATHLWLPNFLDWFALGMLLAVCVAWNDLGRKVPDWLQALADNSWACVLLSAQCYAVLALLRHTAGTGTLGGVRESEVDMTIRFFFNGFGAFLLLLPGVLGRRRGDWLHRGFGLRSLAALGTMSYGIYLWHTIWIRVGVDQIWGTTLPPPDPTPGAVILLIGAVFALTLLSALASYLLIEYPVMRFKDPHRRRATVGDDRLDRAAEREPAASSLP